MAIVIDVPGATPEEIARGIAAAWRVFYSASVTPEEAADGAFAVEGLEFGQAVEDRDFDRAEIWGAADDAALDACCQGWPEDRKPSSARLELKEAREAAERRISSRGVYVRILGQPLIDRNGGTV